MDRIGNKTFPWSYFTKLTKEFPQVLFHLVRGGGRHPLIFRIRGLWVNRLVNRLLPPKKVIFL